MCGLVGMVSKKTTGFFGVHKDIFKQMLYANAVRGHDATGCFGVDKNGNVDWMKQSSASGWFIGTKEFETFSNKIVSNHHMVIGHNRKATHGAKRDQDAHPFTKEHITLVHNGMIHNHKEFCKDSTVDSQAITNALAQKDVVDVISDINGAFAFIWYDAKQKTLFFVRNNLRPLSVVETDNCFFLVSEALLAGWVVSRNNEKIVSTTHCEEHVLYSINLDDKVLKSSKLELKKKTPVLQLPQYHQRNHNFGGMHFGYGEDDETLFLDTKTVTQNPVVWAERGMQVLCELTDYEDPTDPEFKGEVLEITGRLLNCDLKGPVIKATIGIAELPAFLETCVFHGRVKSVSMGNGIEVPHRLYVTLPTVCDTVVTKNDVIITAEMWRSDIFPNTCTKCNTHISWKDLQNTSVSIEYNLVSPAEVKCTCEKCLGDSRNVQ